VKLRLASSIDPHPIGPLLGEAADTWLRQFTWTNPPHATGEISLVVPSWTNRHPNFETEILPSFSLRGEFDVAGGGSYRGLQASFARFISATSAALGACPSGGKAPGGQVRAVHMDDELGWRFYWKFDSTVHEAAHPALKETRPRC
jgi:hypothetical protein